jgi:hypothetical protein
MRTTSVVTAASRAAFQPRLAALEKSCTYPLGTDTFHIDHGRDYFKFFDRLGTSRHYVVEDASLPAAEGSLAAALCYVRRAVPLRFDGPVRYSTVYASDFKVHALRRRQHLGSSLVARSLAREWFVPAWRGYAISMNPSGKENHVPRCVAGRRRRRDAAFAAVAALAQRPPSPSPAPTRQQLRFAVFLCRCRVVNSTLLGHLGVRTAQLGIWSLDADAMRRAWPVVSQHRGPLSLLSLRGTKDIVLASTGSPMPLFHCQFGTLADASPTSLRVTVSGSVATASRRRFVRHPSLSRLLARRLNCQCLRVRAVPSRRRGAHVLHAPHRRAECCGRGGCGSARRDRDDHVAAHDGQRLHIRDDVGHLTGATAVTGTASPATCERQRERRR